MTYATTSGDLGEALVDALGLKGKPIVSITLIADASKIVRADVSMNVTREQMEAVIEEVRHYKLVPLFDNTQQTLAAQGQS